MQVLLLALPLAAVFAWLKMSLYVLRPFAIERTGRRFASFSLIDLGCLLAQLSFVGMLVIKYVESESQQNIAGSAIGIIVLLTVEAVAIWWLSIHCLAARDVKSSPKRVVFELFVTPVAAYFPLLLAAPALVTGEINRASLGIGAILAIASLAVSIRLARWVAQPSACAAEVPPVKLFPSVTPKSLETST